MNIEIMPLEFCASYLNEKDISAFELHKIIKASQYYFEIDSTKILSREHSFHDPDLSKDIKEHVMFEFSTLNVENVIVVYKVLREGCHILLMTIGNLTLEQLNHLFKIKAFI